MNWKHKVNLDWLKARQGFLTASEVAKLVPFTKSGQARKITDDTRMGIMAKKWATVTEDDCWSRGAAARGHLLEPYAIAAYNEMAEKIEDELPVLHHWDDSVVYASPSVGNLAFSPDALDAPFSSSFCPRVSLAELEVQPKALGEIKCYDDDKHIITAYSDKMSLEERWQIATAMAVCPTIEDAYLILFNPRMKFRKLYVIRYGRNELLKEIDIIRKVEEDWMEFLGKEEKMSVKAWSTTPDQFVYTGGGNEEDIIADIQRRQHINP